MPTVTELLATGTWPMWMEVISKAGNELALRRAWPFDPWLVK
jgi:hypothetical protein